MGMSSDDKVCSTFPEDGSPFLLHIVCSKIVFCSPVGAYNGEIGVFLSVGKVLFYLFFFKKIHCIGHTAGHWDSVGSVGIIQNGNLYSVFLDDIDTLFIFLSFVYSQHRYIRMIVSPIVYGVHKACFSLVQGVIGGVENNVESGINKGVSDRIWSVEAGVS